MSTLTEEQRRRIEENREKALAKRRAKIPQNRNHEKFRRPAQDLSQIQKVGKISANTNSGNTNLNKLLVINSAQNVFNGEYKTLIDKTVSADSLNLETNKITKSNNSKNVAGDTFHPIFRLKPSVTKTRKSNAAHSDIFKISQSEIIAINSEKPSKLKVNAIKQNGRAGHIFTAVCTLLSADRFAVECGYHKELQEIFKAMPSRAYDVKTKRWHFNIEDHDRLLKAVQSLQPEVTLGAIPTFVYQQLKVSYEVQDHSVLNSIYPSVRNALLPFQADGVRFALSRRGRVLIADDMGLGKTIQAIAIADFYREEWPVLCVAPSSVRYAWSQAFRNWLPHLTEKQVFIINSNKDIIRKSARVIIISYDLLSKQYKELSELDYQVIIMDESHFIKNIKSARTRAAQEVCKNCNRIILLSGTPALSRPSELYPQLNMLNKKFFNNFVQFGIRYCNGKKVPWGNGWDFKGSSNMKELQILLTSNFMIRRLKSEVLSELPSKQRRMIILDPNLVDKKTHMMEAAEKKMHLKSVKGMEKHGALLQYFSETSSAKLEAVSHYIGDLVEGGRKFLCFAHHQVMIVHICDSLAKKKVKFIRIDGHTSSEKRKELCDSFQVKDYQVAVLSITAANAGITLTAANLVVFAELFWNPGILTQAEDRVHRIGQENLVNVHYLVAKGTADDFLWPLVQQKLDVLNKAGLSKDNFTDASTTLCADSKKQTCILEFLEDIGDEFFNDDDSFCESLQDSKRKKTV